MRNHPFDNRTPHPQQWLPRNKKITILLINLQRGSVRNRTVSTSSHGRRGHLRPRDERRALDGGGKGGDVVFRQRLRRQVFLRLPGLLPRPGRLGKTR